MITAHPLVDLLFRRGAFSAADTTDTSILVTLFAITLAFWSVQGLYARAFYAANDTLTPMLYGTLITVSSLFLYSFLFDKKGVIGLIWASNIAIVIHTMVLARLLNAKGLVTFNDLPGVDLFFTFGFSLVITCFAFDPHYLLIPLGIFLFIFVSTPFIDFKMMKGEFPWKKTFLLIVCSMPTGALLYYIPRLFGLNFTSRVQSITLLIIDSVVWVFGSFMFAHFMKLPIYEQLKRKLRGTVFPDNVPS